MPSDGANALVAHSIFRRVIPKESDGSLNIFNRGRVTEAWRLTMVQYEESVPSTQQTRRHRGLSILQGAPVVRLRRVPSGAVDEDHAITVWLIWIVHIQEQSET